MRLARVLNGFFSKSFSFFQSDFTCFKGILTVFSWFLMSFIRFSTFLGVYCVFHYILSNFKSIFLGISQSRIKLWSGEPNIVPFFVVFFLILSIFCVGFERCGWWGGAATTGGRKDAIIRRVGISTKVSFCSNLPACVLLILDTYSSVGSFELTDGSA